MKVVKSDKPLPKGGYGNEEGTNASVDYGRKDSKTTEQKKNKEKEREESDANEKENEDDASEAKHQPNMPNEKTGWSKADPDKESAVEGGSDRK